MAKNKGTMLSLGFSFGLRPDGTPGKCNDRIAKDMAEYEEKLGENELTIITGVQWEIADARAIGKYSCPKEYYVCEPPSVKPSDIIRPELISCLIELHEFEAIKCLGNRLSGKQLDKRESIAEAFNDLLKDKLLFGKFKALLDFHDLARKDKGILGIEKRCIPQTNEPLQAYQAVRVNRLILESIFDESMLKTCKYLNTFEVAGMLLEKIKDSVSTSSIEAILVFCHPSHLFWCGYNVAKQVLEFQKFKDKIPFGTRLKEKCKEIKYSFEEFKKYSPDSRAEKCNLLESESPIRWGELDLRIDYNPSSDEWWDSESAQVWMRSKHNHEKYNSMP